MADGVDITPGSGATVATDEASSKHYQVVKLANGAADSETRIEAGGGVEANAMRVTIASDSTGVVSVDDGGGSLTVDGTVTANTGLDQPLTDTQLRASDVAVTLDSEAVVLGAGTAAIGKLAANSGVDIGDVTINNASDIPVTLDGESVAVTGPLTDTELRATAVPVSGTVTAELSATDNTVLDAIQTAVEVIDNAISGSEMQVDVVGSLPAGTALIGKVGIDQATANANEVVVKSGTVTAVTSITNAVAVTDNGGNLSIDDGGNTITVDGTVAVTDGDGSLTVDGTVTANLSATDNAVLDDIAAKLATIDADTSTLAAAVSTEVQVDVVGSLPAGTNAIGKLAANSGVDIGDVDVTSIAAGTNNIGKTDSPITTPTVYNVTLTDADTEYSQALPENTRYVEFQCRTAFDIRYAFATGKVATPTAPYMTLKSGGYYYSPTIMQTASPSTLYLGTDEAGVIVEIIAWT